ncbi:MAG: hypothetical protein B7Z73_19395 [Planctomycetia bacterium 21-64-5]|nr:MAG: hypothetical protein B7Z73_19395 [Planctomycetia bacterium 21-64-5]
MIKRQDTRSAADDCLDMLRDQIVGAWPKPGRDEPPDYRQRMASVLARDFDPVDFANRVAQVADVVGIWPTSDRVEVQFHDSDGCLQRAVFTPASGDAWVLQSLKFQCPACFGTGVNNGECCDMCGGAGWGVA